MGSANTRSATAARDFLETRGFSFVEEIGSGTFAVVEKYTHSKRTYPTAVVAIKTVSKSRAGESYVEDCYPLEVECWRALTHPHVVRLLGVMETPNFIFFIMKMNKTDLFHYVNDKLYLTSHETKRFAYQLLTALLHMHEKGFSHTDVKMENVLISQNLDVELSDFGYAQKLSRTSVRFDGTDGYRAPEVCASIPFDTEKADSFSYGVVLFYMAGGQTLMKSERKGLLVANWQDQISNQKLLKLMERCLEASPNDRYDFFAIHSSPYFYDYRKNEELDEIKPKRLRVK